MDLVGTPTLSGVRVRARDPDEPGDGHRRLCDCVQAPGRAAAIPGKPGAYHSLIEMTDAGLLTRAMVWAATDPAAANQAYNISNGDLFRWEEMWPKLASYFDSRSHPACR